MVILLDSSASITRDQFAASKKFATDLVKYFKISKERTNVAAFHSVNTLAQEDHSAMMPLRKLS